LDAGAHLNVNGGAFHAVLRAARVNGHSAIEKRLLEAGAEEVDFTSPPDSQGESLDYHVSS
jgi:hypothetical protein